VDYADINELAEDNDYVDINTSTEQRSGNNTDYDADDDEPGKCTVNGQVLTRGHIKAQKSGLICISILQNRRTPGNSVEVL